MGETFNELALMYSEPSDVRIRCTRSAKVWVLERLAFRETMAQVRLLGSVKHTQSFLQVGRCAARACEPGSRARAAARP